MVPAAGREWAARYGGTVAGAFALDEVGRTRPCEHVSKRRVGRGGFLIETGSIQESGHWVAEYGAAGRAGRGPRRACGE